MTAQQAKRLILSRVPWAKDAYVVKCATGWVASAYNTTPEEHKRDSRRALAKEVHCSARGMNPEQAALDLLSACGVKP